MTMPRHPFLLAVDVGTSTLKAVLYAEDGATLAVASERYGYTSPQPDWAESDPEDWWRAFQSALHRLHNDGHSFDRLQFLAVTGQMHSAVLLDSRRLPVGPVILWLDRRAAEETAELQRMTGMPPYQLNSTYTLPRLLWLARHRPEVAERVCHIIWPKDYLRFCLTGRLLSDRTEAGGAALLDWDTKEWASERLSMIGLDPEILPPFGRPTDDAGPLLSEVAATLNLPPDIKVLTGVGDVLALITASPLKKGRVTCSLGSSSMVFYPMMGGKSCDDPQGRLYTYPLLPYPMLGGVSSTSGASLHWAVQTLYGGEIPYGDAVEAALRTPAGADDLFFMPFLSGERSPFWNDGLSGGFYGLRLAHTRPHMLRAVMEGVAYSLRYLLDIYKELDIQLDEIALAGGGAQTPGWAQIFADVCEMPVSIYSGQETVTHGLYAYACQALDAGVSFEQALDRTFQQPVHVTPDPSVTQTYHHIYSVYRELSAAVNDLNL